MTEYWKSTPKYYCKTCNIWIADNRVSRENHDKSVKHKQRVQDALKLRREQKLHGARNEDELKRQLRDIEAAARAQVAADRENSGGLFYQNVPSEPLPVHAGRVHAEYAASAPGHDSAGGFERPRHQHRADDEFPGEAEPPSDGKYTVRGQTYLEGQVHEDKLLIGTPCEVWIEELEEWMPAHITGRNEVPVPNTAIVILRFKLTYQKDKEANQPSEATNEDEPKTGNEETIENVKSDQIRLKCDRSGNWDPRLVQLKGRTVNEVDLVTGLGSWQTVSVRLVDEEQERIDREERAQQEAEAAAEQERLQRLRTARELAAIESSDAMSSYDPYGTGVYKGVKVETTVVDESFLPESTGEQVSFKKRTTSTAGGGAGAKKRIRKKVAEDEDGER